MALGALRGAALTLAEPTSDPRQRLGRRGESIAEEVLRRAGLRILARRYRWRSTEIDLVAADGELIVFAEVKTRGGAGYGWPAEAVTASKRRHLARGALAFLARRGWLDRPCRFDVVEVLVDARGNPRVRHIEDAFRL
jgi:putative endonuclease